MRTIGENENSNLRCFYLNDFIRMQRSYAYSKPGECLSDNGDAATNSDETKTADQRHQGSSRNF